MEDLSASARIWLESTLEMIESKPKDTFSYKSERSLLTLARSVVYSIVNSNATAFAFLAGFLCLLRGVYVPSKSFSLPLGLGPFH